MLGPCRLCQTPNSDLQDSHILSKFLYKRVRGAMDDGTSSDPVVVKNGEARQTGKQEKEYLLCRECEQRFGDAENIVARLAWKGGKSALLEQLGPTIGALDDGACVRAPGSVRLDALAYFGASILWRGSIARAITKCSLGPKYEEEFRRFLYGSDAFPQSAACTLTAFDNPTGSDGDIRAFAASPTSARKNGHHFHTFVLVGVRFSFFVGQDLPAGVRYACAVRGTVPAIFVAPQRMLVNEAGRWIANSRSIGAPWRGA